MCHDDFARESPYSRAIHISLIFLKNNRRFVKARGTTVCITLVKKLGVNQLEVAKI